MVLLLKSILSNYIFGGGRMKIGVKVKGNTNKTESWLEKMRTAQLFKNLDKYGQKGVEALSAATPVDTGLTAASWYYKIERNSDCIKIIWNNSNKPQGIPIAIILQYGHGTGTGGYVEGIDYINPAMSPIFDEIANAIKMEVVKL